MLWDTTTTIYFFFEFEILILSQENKVQFKIKNNLAVIIDSPQVKE